MTTPLPPLGPITHLTIHCTATPEGLHCSGEQIEAMDIARFGQPSYHIIVLLDGTEHRSLPDTAKGAHVAAHNTGNIGVSYVGGIDRVTRKPKDTRTPEQRATLRRIAERYQAQHAGIRIMGHRDWSPDLNHDGRITPNEWVKSCPCFDVAAWLKETAL